MKYHTIKSERFSLRCNGSFATYPVYLHETGEKVANLSCYAENVDGHLNQANERGNIDFAPFFKYNQEYPVLTNERTN